MTFHQIFRNHHKKYALDCGTITCTYLNEKNLQILGSLMNNNLSIAFERCGVRLLDDCTQLLLFLSFLFVAHLFIFFLGSVHKMDNLI